MTTHTDLIARLREYAAYDKPCVTTHAEAANALESLEQQVAALTEQRDRAEQQVKELLWDDPVEPSFGPAFGDLLVYLNHQTPHPTELYQMMSNGTKLWQQMKDQVAALTRAVDTDYEQLYREEAAKVADLTKERSALQDKLNAVVTVGIREREQLVAAQAREAKLREALIHIRDTSGLRTGTNVFHLEIQKVLALPTDDSALMERLKEERERCAKVCDELQKTSYLTIGTTLARMIRELS